MGSSPRASLNVRLKLTVKKRLARLAMVSGRSSDSLVTDAVESYVSSHERMLAEIDQGERQLKAGHYIKHEDMKEWLLSWGTKRELPPPKCICGKRHDNESL